MHQLQTALAGAYAKSVKGVDVTVIVKETFRVSLWGFNDTLPIEPVTR